MTEIYYRCTACLGSKKGMKLGCVEGECNLCKGEGRINEKDRPKPVVIEEVIPVIQVVEAVNAVVAPSVIDEIIEPELAKDIVSQVSTAKSKPIFTENNRKVFKRVKGKSV